MTQARTAREGHDADAEILGLEPHQADPVTVILAARERLRRCRQDQADGSPCTPGEIRRIIAARDALLSRAVGFLTGPTPTHKAADAALTGGGGVE